MFEGLQVITNLPLFNLKTPGCINFFNKVFHDLANFDIVDIGIVTNEMGYYPEEDSFSL